MRRLILLLLALLVAPPAWARSTHDLPDAQTESQAWWGDAMHGYVVEGCLPARPASGATLTLPPCRAYGLEQAAGPQLRYLWEPTARSLALPGDGLHWLAVHATTTAVAPGWTPVAGTHYRWRISATRPMAPDGGLLVAQVQVTSGAVTEVGDLRPDNPVSPVANLRAPLYGAKADCTTDDTVAIQTWINNTRWRNTTGYAPAGCYAMTRLWLNYDAVHNPGFPSASAAQGNYTLAGAGSMQAVIHDFLHPTLWNGTIFLSSATDGPMLTATGPTGVGTGNPLRGLSFGRLSLVQTTATYVVSLTGLHAGVEVADVLIVQRGTGGGLEWHNIWLADIRDSFIYTPTTTAASNLGIGLHIYNDGTGAGGIVLLSDVTVRNFGGGKPVLGECIRMGTDVTANRLQSLVLTGVQAGGCPIGLHVMHAVRGLLCTGCYFEGYKQYGMLIDNDAWGVTVQGSWFAGAQLSNPATASLKIGGGSGGLIAGAKGIVVRGNVFEDTNNGYAIWRDVGGSVVGAVIEANVINVNPATVAGIYCGTAGLIQQNQMIIKANAWDVATGVLIDPGCDSTEELLTTSVHRFNRRVNFGQGILVDAAASVTLPGDGNVYPLAGAATVATLVCPTCTPGAQVWFYVTPGSTPTMDESGNLLLAGASWSGDSNDVIGLVYTTTGKWHEMYRSAN